ncbi:MAG: trans-hexaprenyltranstransferase [Clostridiales bacterium]|nr:trans-hexaprenyltranstransferase [Clostridiales bacterium]
MQWTQYPEILDELLIVEDKMKKSVLSRNRLLSNIVNDLMQSGGKRLRPAFVLLASKFGDCDNNKIFPLAGAMEILHMATLVHDDIIDRSKLRRGKVTVSEKYGMDMAVYVGDFLLTKAILMLSSDVSQDNLVDIASSVKTICEGEVDQYQGKFNIDTSIFNYLKRINRKTAVLFAVCCGVGAHAAGCPDSFRRSLVKFGLSYGSAFQIRDDLNDYLSSQANSGKPVIKDIIEGIVTLPAIYAMKRNKAVKTMISNFLGKSDKSSKEDLDEIVNMVVSNGGVRDAEDLLRRYIARGIEALKPLPDGVHKRILVDLITELKIIDN